MYTTTKIVNTNMKLLKNATKPQIISLWICVVIVILSALISETTFMICGIAFIYLLFIIEVWNSAGEKEQLKKRIKELEETQSD